MPKAKPILVIVVAVALAAGGAVYLSRENSEAARDSQPATLSAKPGGGKIRGKADAPVTLVEFGDYQCPTCRIYHMMVSELQRRYPDKVKLEFHHYPLVTVHRNAMNASLAAEAAGEQGRYWEMHDLIFENQERWATSANPETEFLTYISRLGLNANQFMQSVRSPATQQKVLEDVMRGNQAHVNRTPTFFVNGQEIDPLPQNVDEFVRMVDDYLRAAK